MPRPKRFVYILKSINSEGRYYVGLTSDITAGWLPTTLDSHPTPHDIAPGEPSS